MMNNCGDDFFVSVRVGEILEEKDFGRGERDFVS